MSGSTPDPGIAYRRVKQIWFRALDLEPGEREAWVVRACGGDRALHDEVMSLLGHYEQDDAFLRDPVVASQDGLAEREPHERREGIGHLPERVGPYRILERLGFGGMGVVYLAEQERPRRRVALKVLRHDCGGTAAQERFEREAQALGRLRHPGIAQVIEAGVADTEVGFQPYIAMELVRGAPLGEHCRRRRLGLAERLELFLQICEAIHHAHVQGVVHRDLKPDNVFVEDSGRVKVLDFGVARLEDVGEEGFRTRTGQVVGTAAYMSPEQARGAAVDERSDLYSLGVMLYELATGRLPRESRGGRLDGLPDSFHRDPLSMHRPDLRGDFERIVEKTLEDDPARRYSSVHELELDLRRYLDGRPVLARPATPWYRVRKLVARHRALTASILAVGLALASGLLVALRAWRTAEDSGARLAARNEDVLSLAHERRLVNLQEEVDRLWPIGPELVPRLRAWLTDAEELARHVGEHEARLQEMLQQRALGDGASSGEPEDDEHFLWLLESRQSLLAGLHRMFDPGPGDDASEYARVRRRLVQSRTLVSRTVLEHGAAWERALVSIADPSGPYGGLWMRPQPGLVPLGPDPQSGLQEFALYGDAGTVPRRHPDTGQLVHLQETTVVLVLLPGGTFWMGSQGVDPALPNFDPGTRPHEWAPRVVELDPFFLGKYEVTQGQWQRIMGSNPSYWRPGKEEKGYHFTWLHPVEHVTWNQSIEFCWRLGCVLPTEARWEFAARVGSPEASPDLDWTCVAHVAPSDPDPGSWRHPMKPGFRWNGLLTGIHAPVGSYPADGLGLHDLFGNLTEWSADGFKADLLNARSRSGDGLVLEEADEGRSTRGGECWQRKTLYAGFRTDFQAVDHKETLGLRMARNVEGPWRRLSVPDFTKSGATQRLAFVSPAVETLDR